MAAPAFEPGRHAAELIVVLEQEHAMPGASQNVRRRHPGQTAADDNDVVGIASPFEKILGHGRSSTRSASGTENIEDLLPPRRALMFEIGDPSAKPGMHVGAGARLTGGGLWGASAPPAGGPPPRPGPPPPPPRPNPAPPPHHPLIPPPPS